MISPELIRRYPFSSGLSQSQIVTLAKTAAEKTVRTGQFFFHEGDELDAVYLIVDGSVGIVIEVPDQAIQQKVSRQLTGELHTKDVVISALGPGDVFGSSAIIHPYTATGSAKATTDCRVIQFDAGQLRHIFAEDCAFGFLMMQKAAQVIRGRLRDIRIESLAYLM